MWAYHVMWLQAAWYDVFLLVSVIWENNESLEAIELCDLISVLKLFHLLYIVSRWVKGESKVRKTI